MMSLLDISYHINSTDKTHFFPSGSYKNEFVRKLFHIAVSLVCISLGSVLSLRGGIALGIFSLIGLYIAGSTPLALYVKNVRRVSFGHYFMVLGVMIAFAAYKLHVSSYSFTYFAYSLLALGFGDAFAVTGKYVSHFIQKRKGKPLFSLFSWLTIECNHKTIAGFCIMWVISIVVAFVSLYTKSPITFLSLVKLGLLAGVLAVLEFFSKYGADNILIPVASMFLLIFVW